MQAAASFDEAGECAAGRGIGACRQAGRSVQDRARGRRTLQLERVWRAIASWRKLKVTRTPSLLALSLYLQGSLEDRVGLFLTRAASAGVLAVQSAHLHRFIHGHLPPSAAAFLSVRFERTEGRISTHKMYAMLHLRDLAQGFGHCRL